MSVKSELQERHARERKKREQEAARRRAAGGEDNNQADFARLLAVLAFEESPARKARDVARACRWIHGAEEAAAEGDLLTLDKIAREVSDATGIVVPILTGRAFGFRWSRWNKGRVNSDWLTAETLVDALMADLEKKGLSEMFVAAEEIRRRKLQ